MVKIHVYGSEVGVGEDVPASLAMTWIEACALKNRLEDVINSSKELGGGTDGMVVIDLGGLR